MRKLMISLIILTIITVGFWLYGVAVIGSYIFKNYAEYYGICYLIVTGMYVAVFTYVAIKMKEKTKIFYYPWR